MGRDDGVLELAHSGCWLLSFLQGVGKKEVPVW